VQGRLEAEELGRFERHVGACAHCSDLVAAAAAVWGMQASQPPAVMDAVTVPRASAPAGALQPDTVLRDTYRIVRFIERGGIGEVYEARHARLAGRYAVKVLSARAAADPAALARFRREAEITSGLQHPNIVQVIDFDQTPAGEPYLVMEFLVGRDLAEHLKQTGPLALPAVLGIVEPIVSALAAVHERGIVHRDLKPKNVFLQEAAGGGGTTVKLLDFGLSKVQAASLAVSAEVMLLGTPLYMAPEQARGKVDEVGAAADQFALAAMIYEMLTGKPAFAAAGLEAIIYQVLHSEPAPLQEVAPAVPRAVASVIGRSLRKKPEDRYASVTELLGELRRAAGLERDAPSLVARRARRRPSRFEVVGVGAGLVALGGLASWLLLRPGSTSPPRPSAPPPVAVHRTPPPQPSRPSPPPTAATATTTATTEPPAPVAVAARTARKAAKARIEKPPLVEAASALPRVPVVAPPPERPPAGEAAEPDASPPALTPGLIRDWKTPSPRADRGAPGQ
jgi:serine/threonine-protein kinase